MVNEEVHDLNKAVREDPDPKSLGIERDFFDAVFSEEDGFGEIQFLLKRPFPKDVQQGPEPENRQLKTQRVGINLWC